MTNRLVVVVCVVAVGLLLVACASSSDENACPVDGTYSVTGVVESGNCGTSADPVTDTFRTLPNGSVELLIQGLPDLVPIGTMNGCTWTATIAPTVLDATGPEKTATLQYSYTFNRTGLSGILSQAVPPFKGSASGCRGTTKVTGVRR